MATQLPCPSGRLLSSVSWGPGQAPPAASTLREALVAHPGCGRVLAGSSEEVQGMVAMIHIVSLCPCSPSLKTPWDGKGPLS